MAIDTATAPRDGDYLVRTDGTVHAGTHVLVDFWDASHLDDAAIVESALREAAAACKAELLHIHVHPFQENGGVSGVAVLAESHISIHTWPEIGFAAFDVFMCGRCEPENAIPILRRRFRPGRESVEVRRRGVLG